MRRASMLLALVALCSCDSSPVAIAGNYTLAVTNHDNGCNFSNWVVGDNSTGIPLTVTQNGSDVTAMLEGATGVWVEAVLGDRTFTGKVSGDKMDVTLYGTRSLTQGNCTYTVNARAVATLANDALTGSIDYTPATNGNPDCSTIDGCVSTQAFNGTRPPE
jgi:hypothetical protein